MYTKVTLEDLFADIEIDDRDFAYIKEECSRQETYEKFLKQNPNAIVLHETYMWAKEVDNDKDSRRFKAWMNMLKMFIVEFSHDPYWNSRLGWMMWFWVCYARYDSYHPMNWCFHYDPMNFYRTGEPMRPPELQKTKLDDPFNIKGECFVHPEWYKYRAEDKAAEVPDATSEVQE